MTRILLLLLAMTLTPQGTVRFADRDNDVQRNTRSDVRDDRVRDTVRHGSHATMPIHSGVNRQQLRPDSNRVQDVRLDVHRDTNRQTLRNSLDRSGFEPASSLTHARSHR